MTIVYFEVKCEFGAVKILRFELDLSIELLNNHLADDQSQADSFGIKLGFWILNRAKHFEKFGLVFFFYANSGISDKDFDEAIRYIDRLYLYTAFPISKLNRIRQQIQEHLL